MKAASKHFQDIALLMRYTDWEGIVDEISQVDMEK